MSTEKKVIYDIAATPEGGDLNEIFEFYKNHHWLFYNSSLGTAPKVIDDDGYTIFFDVKNDKERKFFSKALNELREKEKNG